MKITAAVPWHRSGLSQDGSHLIVVACTSGEPFDHIDLSETPEAVTITAFVKGPVGMRAVLRARVVEIELRTPLAGRPVIDGTTGRQPDQIEPGGLGERYLRAYALDERITDTCHESVPVRYR